ncbi:glycosyltransferase family 2 protein [Luteimonas aquatica]|uniref:glycosyltransferase family 2 protein n=1 Tax=Luteimonas aquatica TaxID=450364 RepID=UPI001F578447|nr:glycosyltransferase family 2 protein [Luteimonas aquatica]
MPNPRIPAVSVVSPVYGCSGCLEDLVDRIALALASSGGGDFEVILVDDASPDGAWPRIVELAATRPWLRGLRLARNFGQHYAISAGIESARGDRVVVMDCDLQDVPEEIPNLLGHLGNGIEVVFAQRAERQDSVSKRLGSWLFFKLLSWMTGVAQDHTTANFGAYSRKVIDAVNAMPERERCFPLMVKWTGFRHIAVPVAHASRSAGKSGYSFKRLRKLAIGIILSYSDKPLRLVVRVGLVFAAVAFAMVALSVARYLHGDVQVAGFTSVIASIWLVGGMAIFCIGIIGLYLGRLFVDAKARPYYLLAEEIGGDGPAVPASRGPSP